MNRELHSGVMQLRREARGIASRADELLTASRTGTVDCLRVDHESPMHLAHYTSLEALVSNVPDHDDGKRALENLLESQGRAPNVVRIRVSEIPYRPR